MCGAVLASAALTAIYSATSGVGVPQNGQIDVNGTAVGPTIGSPVGRTICHALDLTNKRYWARLGNGDWNLSQTANPATNVGGVDVSTVFTGAALAAAVASSSSAGGMDVTANFGATTYACSAPSGFTNWDGTACSNPAGSAAVIWDPLTCSTIVTLSGGNLTAADNATSNGGCYSNSTATTGKFYYEALVNANDQVLYSVIGVALRDVDTEHMYAAAHGIGVAGGGEIILNGANNTALGATTVGQTVCLAIDLGAKLFWARINGGNWNASSTANPATGVGGIDISSVFNGTVASPMMSASSSGAGVGSTSFTANFGATAYSFTAPAGFSNWAGSVVPPSHAYFQARVIT